MKRFTAYHREDDGTRVTAFNDALGPAIVCFRQPFRPGASAQRNFAFVRDSSNKTTARFRIIREVHLPELIKIFDAADLKFPPAPGWWYEVIGD